VTRRRERRWKLLRKGGSLEIKSGREREERGGEMGGREQRNRCGNARGNDGGLEIDQEIERGKRGRGRDVSPSLNLA